MQNIFSKKQSRILALLLAIVLALTTFNIRITKAKQLTVVISPGHAVGYDPGTTSSDLITEAELNERVAATLMEELDSRGYQVYLTHHSDPKYKNRCLSDPETCDTLRNVGPIVNAVKPDLVYCIHHNSTAVVPSTVSGMEIYWSSYRDYDTTGVYTDPTLWDNTGGFKDTSPCEDARESLRLANLVFNAFQGMPNMDPPRSINERNDYLPAHAEAPCILYEGGYLSTPSDAQYMATQSYAKEASKRLASAVDLYFGNSRPVPGTDTTPKEIKMTAGTQTKLSTVNVPNINTNDSFLYVSNDPSVATVDENGTVKGIKEGNTEIVVTPSNNPSVKEKIPVTIYPASNLKVDYQVYTEKGWQSASNGTLAGSTNTGFPIFAVKASVKDENSNMVNPDVLNLSYRTHIANVGWTEYTSSGQVSGSENSGNPVEAVEFCINGENAYQYQLYYRTFVKDHSWTSYVTNDQNCGSEGYSYPISGLELMILQNNASMKPTTNGVGFYSNYGDGDLRYSTHISNIGWTGYTSDSNESGTPGSGENVEAINIVPSSDLPSGTINSETHVSYIGWLNSDKSQIGTIGRGLPIEAVKLSLGGELGNQYNINYQVYVKGQGWQNSVSNGEQAGTTGQNLPIESVKLWLTKK